MLRALSRILPGVIKRPLRSSPRAAAKARRRFLVEERSRPASGSAFCPVGPGLTTRDVRSRPVSCELFFPDPLTHRRRLGTKLVTRTSA